MQWLNLNNICRKSIAQNEMQVLQPESIFLRIGKAMLIFSRARVSLTILFQKFLTIAGGYFNVAFATWPQL